MDTAGIYGNGECLIEMGLKDYIFVTGASGIGKTTLANGLLEHYKTTCIGQNMIPEFISRDGVEQMTGELEELTCWENLVAMLKCFHKLGYKNIIASIFQLFLKARIT